MPIVNYAQRSPEWHAWRNGEDLPDGLPRILASDLPVIMRVSPFKSEYQLWREKSGLSTANFFGRAMKHGVDTEDEAREALEMEGGADDESRAALGADIGEVFLPVCVVSRRHPEFGASLDGLNLSGNLLAEIKCPYAEKSHLLAEIGQIPPYYLPQIQWQMMCADVNQAVYFSYYKPYKGAIRKKSIRVDADPTLWEIMIEAAFKFRQCIADGIPPAGEAYVQTALTYRRTKREIERVLGMAEPLKAQLVAIEETLKSLLPPGDEKAKLEGGGLSVSRYGTGGSVDYKSLVEHLKVDDAVMDSFKFVDYKALVEHLEVNKEEIDRFRSGGKISFRFTEQSAEPIPEVAATQAISHKVSKKEGELDYSF